MQSEHRKNTNLFKKKGLTKPRKCNMINSSKLVMTNLVSIVSDMVPET